MGRKRLRSPRSKAGPLFTVHIAFVAWLFLFAGTVQADNIVPANDAREHIGEVVTVEGTVTATRVEGKNVFLSLGSEGEDLFTAAISPPLLLSGFPAHPEDYYKGKTIRVKGAIFSIHGRPAVLVTDPAHIEVVRERPHLSEVLDPSTPLRAGLAQDRPFDQAQDRLVLQPATPQLEVARAPGACREAQGLWQQVAADLVPRLQSLGSCLEQGTPGCQDHSESVAAGLFSLQRVEKQLRAACP